MAEHTDADREETSTTGGRPMRGMPLPLRVVHWAIIVNFLVNIFYGSFQLFVTLKPEGVDGPLWGAAKSIPHELLVARRLYAIEVWICIAGLAIYLALTEFLPRMWRMRSRND